MNSRNFFRRMCQVLLFALINGWLGTMGFAAESFTWCGGELTFEADRWGYNNGSWVIYGWFFHRDDTSILSLRIDGSSIYATANTHTTCTPFTSVTYSADDVLDIAAIQFQSPMGRITQTFKGVTGGCCSLEISTTIENTDSAAHYYEWREYHDLGFGENEALCAVTPAPSPTPHPKEVIADGGKVCLGNLAKCWEKETHMENIPCEIGMLFWNPDKNAASCSFQFTGFNLPYDVEVLDWSSGLFPCLKWDELILDNPIGGCEDDDSVLMIWRIPERGNLLPGEKSSVTYMISNGCIQPCSYPTPIISPPLEFTPTPTSTPAARLPIGQGSFLLIAAILLTLLLALNRMYLK